MQIKFCKSKLNIILLHSSNYNCIKTYGPRCLYGVNKSTILDIQIEILNKSFKNPNIIIIAGFKYKKIRNHIKKYNNVKTIENQDYEKTNDLYSIGLGIKNLHNNVLIIQDNLFIKDNMFKIFKKNTSQLFISNIQKFELGCILHQTGIISNISWGLPNYWTNISYYQNNEFKLLKKIATLETVQKWFLVEGINWIINNGGQFITKLIEEPIPTIDKTYVTTKNSNISR